MGYPRMQTCKNISKWTKTCTNICRKYKQSITFALCNNLNKLFKGGGEGADRMRWLDGITDSVSSVAQSYMTLCNHMDCSTPDFPVHLQLLKLAQTHVCWVGDAIWPSHPLSSPSPPAFNLSQHQGFFQSVSYLRQVAKVLEFQRQHQPFQRIFRTYFHWIDWIDLLAVHGTFKSLLQHHSSKLSICLFSVSLWSNCHIHTWPLEKP